YSSQVRSRKLSVVFSRFMVFPPSVVLAATAAFHGRRKAAAKATGRTRRAGTKWRTARPVFLERSVREEGAAGTGEESRARAVAADAAGATFAQVRKARRSRPEEGWKGPG